MRYLSIKNFSKHQHYKDRRPPWIKLHAEVLDDYDFLCLQDASKAHLMLMWVLASKLDNRIPYDLGFIAKKLGTTSPVDVEELVLQGFIEISQNDSKPLARRKQSAMPETETETEKRTTPAPHDGADWPASWAYDTSQRFLTHGVVIGPKLVGNHAKAAKGVVPWGEWLRVVDRMAKGGKCGYGLPALLRDLPKYRDGEQPDPNRELTFDEAVSL